MGRRRDDYGTWLYFGWSAEETDRLRELVDDLADHVDENEREA
ncbi:hypothetical protein [Halorussus salilacus]|nr:hypothetical protein [Halorussus salilacus]